MASRRAVVALLIAHRVGLTRYRGECLRRRMGSGGISFAKAQGVAAVRHRARHIPATQIAGLEVAVGQQVSSIYDWRIVYCCDIDNRAAIGNTRRTAALSTGVRIAERPVDLYATRRRIVGVFVRDRTHDGVDLIVGHTGGKGQHQLTAAVGVGTDVRG